MRLVEYDKSFKMRKKIDKTITMYYSGIVGGLAFLFGLTADIGAAFVFGLLSFFGVFAFVYGIRSMQTSGVYRRIKALDIKDAYLEVSFRGESGILIFSPQTIIYQTMIKGATNKHFEIPVNEDLFMGYGEFKKRKIRDIKYAGYQPCHITFTELPHGTFSRFRFFDVDGALDKVGQQLNDISVFNAEKHQ